MALDAEELIAWDISISEGDAIKEAFEELKFRAEEHSLKNKKWWRNVRKKYKLEQNSLRVEEGAIFERVPKK